MRITDYSKQAQQTDTLHASGRGLIVRKYGLFGQVGSLLTLVKKESREAQFAAHKNDLLEELGDILWYVNAVANQINVDLVSICQQSAIKLSSIGFVPEILHFEDLDKLSPHHIANSIDGSLQGLAERAGHMMSDDSPQGINFHLIEIVAGLVQTSHSLALSIADAATENLKKIALRWPGPTPIYGPVLDCDAKTFERFPDTLEFDFVQRLLQQEPYVYLQVRGINIGDRLTDNRQDHDGYRFHDVFHIAYAVHLGWSPVLRALLKLKRKSDPEIDVNQDGARAIILEEGISTWIFNHATRENNNYFAEVKQGQLPYRLLKQVSSMMQGYEVDSRPLWQWEAAILDGFKMFRDLLTHGGGTVVANFKDHTLSFQPPIQGEI